MATYQEIHGDAIQNASGTLSGVKEGQVWYDSAAVGWKYQYTQLSAGAWSSGNALNTSRQDFPGAGTQTAAIVFGGTNPPGPTLYAITESFNGTNWTEVNDMGTARKHLGGLGIKQLL